MVLKSVLGDRITSAKYKWNNHQDTLGSHWVVWDVFCSVTNKDVTGKPINAGRGRCFGANG